MSEKRETGIYTAEMRRTALRNAVSYEWAKEIVSKVTEQADGLLKHIDTLYQLIPSEGVPRSYTMSTWNAADSIKKICPYCGINIQKEVKDGLWTVEPTVHPWKVICPKCNSKFPSNDFALLYKRGLDEKGEYNRELAIKNNALAVARGEKDALVNELFPDKDGHWMVDDGFGWSPKNGTYGTLDLSKWAPVAYYHHDFWYIHRETSTHSLIRILDVLREAYLYTGKLEYGQAGAILLDRVADVYPAYDIKKVSLGYSASHGMGWNGKICGSIQEHFLGEKLIKAYDAFYPVMGDETVVQYLSEKAKTLNLSNPKTSGELICENVKNNIVREVYRAVRSGAIYGNFAMHQKVAALAAAALDDEEEIAGILEWLMKPSECDRWGKRGERVRYVDPIYGTTMDLRCDITGGELVDKYIDEIDHDGFGWEVGINYNKFWLLYSLEIAEILRRCKAGNLDLFQNPKFVKMFDTFIHETTANGVSLALGDSGHTAGGLNSFANEMLRGYYVLRDPKLAQYYYFYAEGDLSNVYIDMFTDPEELTLSIKQEIDRYGEYRFESDNLTGFGLTVLREGQHSPDSVNQYDTWLYYGRTLGAHAHRDMLQLGMGAYGFNLTPDLGNPEAKAYQPNRWEWVKATISHNTVVVNGESQTEQYGGKSLHYDSTDIVKLVDVDGAVAYDETDIYRRTVVTISVDENIGYTLDFFRVKGGNSHMYSFHTQSYMGYSSEEVTWLPQTDEYGNYKGTYAGIDVNYGHDPYSTDVVRAEKTMYPRGFTWLTQVNRGNVENGTFSVDFALTDFRKQTRTSEPVHLRYTALNDWTPDSVDMTTGYPPRKKENEVIPGLDYMFIHRSGSNLDTLFCSLLQPYKENCYIEKAECIVPIIKSGAVGQDDAVKVVKVTLKSGLVDYIVYAANQDVLYHIADGNTEFDFRGFVGVYRIDSSGKRVYSYVHDGDVIGDVTGVGSYSGSVIDFTKELAAENQIVVRLNRDPEDVTMLEGRYVYVASESKRNTVYRIKSITRSGENLVLSLGNTTLIERMADRYDIKAGYVYAIAEGQSVTIPVSLDS